MNDVIITNLFNTCLHLSSLASGYGPSKHVSGYVSVLSWLPRLNQSIHLLTVEVGLTRKTVELHSGSREVLGPVGSWLFLEARFPLIHPRYKDFLQICEREGFYNPQPAWAPKRKVFGKVVSLHGHLPCQLDLLAAIVQLVLSRSSKTPQLLQTCLSSPRMNSFFFSLVPSRSTGPLSVPSCNSSLDI